MRLCHAPGIALTLLIASAALAQDGPAETQPNPAPVEDKTVFGVIPNNRTTEASLPFEPISAKRKMTIAVKDSFAAPLGLTSSMFAGLYQFEDQNPSFGQGVAGYARRLGTSYIDLVVGNMMTEGVMPSLLREDPRYFRQGQGSKWSRLRSAFGQILVTRTDSGGRTFNLSEWGGNSVSVAFSNAYYPDTRTVSDNVTKLLLQCANDGVSNVLKEFWPDVKRYFDRRREAKRERELQRLAPAAPQPASGAGSGQN